MIIVSKQGNAMYPHRNHIPQPPHSAGLSYEGIFSPSQPEVRSCDPTPGLRAYIEPSQLPSPTVAIVSDQQEWTSQAFMTLPGKHVPLSTSDFVAIDQGLFLSVDLRDAT